MTRKGSRLSVEHRRKIGEGVRRQSGLGPNPAAVCECDHPRGYHKRQVGPCWYPVRLREGAKPETCKCREYRQEGK